MNLDDESERLVRLLAQRYRRHFAWVEEEDLAQVGRLTALRARDTYRPEAGDWGGYLWCALQQALQRAAWAAHNPVSGGKHRPAEARDLQRVVFEPRHLGQAPSPEDLLTKLRWDAEVRRRVELLARETCGPSGDAVCRVLLDATPAKVAAPENPKALYRHVAKVRERLEADAWLYGLVRENQND